MLEDMLDITDRDLDLLSNQILSDEKNEEQVKGLIEQVSEIIDNSTHTVSKLCVKLLEQATALRMANNSASNDKPVSTALTSTMEAAEKAKEDSEEVKEDTEETTSTTEDPLTSLA